MMRTLTIAILLAGAAVCADGQPLDEIVFEHQDECVNPLRESMGWSLVAGVAVEIDSGRSVLLRDVDDKTFQIDLVGVEIADDGAAARKLLARLILGKSLDVLYNPDFHQGGRILGEAHAAGHNLSRLLLQEGLARYKEPPAYSVSSYSSCLLRIAEREAKQAGLGLWKAEDR